MQAAPMLDRERASSGSNPNVTIPHVRTIRLIIGGTCSSTRIHDPVRNIMFVRNSQHKQMEGIARNDILRRRSSGSSVDSLFQFLRIGLHNQSSGRNSRAKSRQLTGTFATFCRGVTFLQTISTLHLRLASTLRGCGWRGSWSSHVHKFARSTKATSPFASKLPTGRFRDLRRRSNRKHTL